VLTNLKPEQHRIGSHQLVDAVRPDRAVKPAGDAVPDRLEQPTIFIGAVPGGIEAVADQRLSAGM
jgi:hypothetical protein